MKIILYYLGNITSIVATIKCQVYQIVFKLIILSYLFSYKSESIRWWIHYDIFIMSNFAFSTKIVERIEDNRQIYTNRLYRNDPIHFSSHHSFSFRTCSSSLGVKSFLILNVFRISSGVFPLIMLATVLHVTSNRPC